MSTKRLRVCFVIQKLFGLSGGAERVFAQTVTAMAARGMDVEVLVYDTSTRALHFDLGDIAVTNVLPSVLRRRSKPGMASSQTPSIVKNLPYGNMFGSLKWAVTHGMFANRVKRTLHSNPPDVIVAFLPPAITAAVSAGQALGIPVIASTHNLPQEDFGLDSPRWDQNPVYRTRARRALANATSITVLQNEFCDWFSYEEQARITVMPNPVMRLSPVPDPVPKREKLIVAVGRLTDVKRMDLLVGAWQQIHHEFPDWRLEIYGEGPRHDTLTALIAQAGLMGVVKLCGVTANLGAVYDRTSLLCHPAAFEGFGLAVAEAMAHGVPAMGFADCAGINHLISHGSNGFLLQPEHDRTAVLADGLKEALSQPAHLRTLGDASKDILQTYQPDKVASQWFALIQKTALGHSDHKSERH
ncbi:glycosyltransferase involved in cell wall biosynthesis [Planktotalea frisia]|jgi:glycosyltransferase involved in cell wall biosynthesis|uniref:Glycosyltransferase Gtf1 n=1 Tax=Planktotalea frisia TaxID=696762 RepID=A0A1L9NTC4_9RHOB|nr:glycosyltransferase [Planktotalea frisia]OJI92452.1 glycosyltransferase Gtf1 [Planktotalea frisia]PZX23552.1 glycosyltransferase involved in cell wall biosynthesis [Planktotalea frisia]